MKSLRPPRQQRSSASLERLLAAAEEVLRERSFDHAGLGEIAARAGLTVGAFYARFEGKEALLRHLEERVLAAQAALVEEEHRRFVTLGRPLPLLVRDLIQAALGFYRANQGVLRALDLRARGDAALRARLDAAHRAAAERFVGPAGEGPRDAAGQALAFGMRLVGNTLRESALYGRGPEGDAALVRELGRAFLAYLEAVETAA